MPTNTTTTTAAGNSTASGSGGGLPSFPSGWELLTNALTGALQDFTAGVATLVDMFHGRLLTLPASGVPTDPATWAPPTDPYWVAVFTVYGMLSGFVLPLVWGVGWFNVAYPRGVRRRERLKNFATALVLIVVGWTLLQGWMHLWNEAALAFAPSGEEFLSTPGNASKLGVGVVLGVALLTYNALIIVAGIALHLFFVLLTYIFVAIWPLSVGLYATDIFAVETMGASGIMGALVLGPLQFVKALLLRLIFEFPLKLTDPETAVSFLMIAIGVTAAFIIIPYFGLKRLLPRSVFSAGGTVGTRGKSSDRITQLRDHAPSAAALRQRIAAVQSRENSRLRQRTGGNSALQSRDRSSFTTDNGWKFGGGGSDTRTRERGD